MKARVFVTYKSGVLDPQGQAVAGALSRLGYSEVQDVRVGKLIEIEIGGGPGDGDVAAERARLEEMCHKLLANPVLENFRIEYVG